MDVCDAFGIDRDEIIDSLKKAKRTEDVKFLHPAFRLQLDRTSKRKKLFENTLDAFENKKNRD